MSRDLRVVLLDYGAGNLHSLGKALEGGGAEVTVTSDWDEALAAEALVLPGVGAFSAAVEALPDDRERVRRALREGLPCLGICLGMQLFFDASDEGEGEGIGLIPGRVRKLEADVVPQMGWNDVSTADDPLFAGVGDLVAYYANSFVCVPREGGAEQDGGPAIAWSELDGRRFVAGVRAGRTVGVQFHPEKSSHQGRRIVANFLEEVRAMRDAATGSDEHAAGSAEGTP